MKKLIFVTVIGAGALAFSALNASAAIVCTNDVCWHAHESYSYPSDARVTVHEDGWKAGPSIRFREHEGRGYWKGDAWTAW